MDLQMEVIRSCREINMDNDRNLTLHNYNEEIAVKIIRISKIIILDYLFWLFE
ncbi:hypothetical protein [Metabacillus bambusae]|uniref:Uncharacterized protein n=1 Tax=Metabacillus bambusae TaxID=2795218 RepID=A0ABS3NB58_9BACI|nr:hypothetical protein [Metabacillus bambusae]MBO1515457.1 hypothetical protein [Metabacillus bambusae]